MATITKGYTFGATEQVTNTKLHSLVDSATISGIAQADLAAATGVVSRGTSAPSDTDQLWVDTNFTPPLLKFYDGTNWVPVAEANIFTNKSGATATLGQVVIIDTATNEGFKYTSTAGDTKWRGIVAESIANNASGVLVSRGYWPNITIEVSAARGNFLKTSTATGKADPTAAVTDAGVFGMVTTQGTASAGAFLYGYANGGASSASAASQAEMEAGTNTTNPVVPGRTQNHPGVAKAWCNFNGTGTPAMNASYNMDSSITDNGTGDYTVAFTTDFSSANYAYAGMATLSTEQITVFSQTASAAGTKRIKTSHLDGVAKDPTEVCLVAFGDQ